MIKNPYYPIVYIRGYAGNQDEVEDTVADPYMGFNIGATKVRQRWTGDITRHIFESPLVRLMKDHGYMDVFHDGQEITERKLLPEKSVWIYRYYEPVSEDLGTGDRPEIEDYARGLADFLASLRHAYVGDDEEKKKPFKVYLVAHSMGGLVARCFLQKIAPEYVAKRTDPVTGERISDPVAVQVDKVFTYAAPHRGIDFRLVGNVPRFLRFNNIENFNRKRMRDYLAIDDEETPVHSLNNSFDPGRFFCLIGTDSRDYQAAGGFSRKAVGPMSDGLVQIKNAYVSRAPRAFVHRAHSGHYGIVNSEGGYQNLVRFLFGDMRVDGKLMMQELTLPRFAQNAKNKGKQVRASYYVECIARVRAADWDLHRKTVKEESAILCGYDSHVQQQKPVHLFSSFLSKKAIVSNTRKSMGFAIDIRILVPKYEIDGKVKQDKYIKDGYIFRDKLNLRVISEPPETKFYFGWDSNTPNSAPSKAKIDVDAGSWQFKTSIETENDPKIKAELVLQGRLWNARAA